MKSNLLLRYDHGQFKPEHQLTIGVEFESKNLWINEKAIIKIIILLLIEVMIPKTKNN